MRSAAQIALVALWQKRGLLTHLLYPLAWLHRLWTDWVTWIYRVGLRRSYKMRVPVVVVGNLYVGGTGKTPLVIELVKQLKHRGWQPGIVSRGYRAKGKKGSLAREVDPNGSAVEYGDEPVLMAQATGVPVVIGRDRVAAAQLLLNSHARVNVIVTDDGLQHRRLARDVELALIHYRGLGNGWMLPAGPLREPPARLQAIDAVVFHDQLDTPRPAVRVYSPFYTMRTGVHTAYALKDPTRQISLADLARRQREKGIRVVAACGIGMPDRFFAMLRAAGLYVEEIALADHYDFTVNPFATRVYDCALITEKDAVKCRANAVLAADGRICVVPLATELDPGLVDFVTSLLHWANDKRADRADRNTNMPHTSHGPATA